MNVIAILENFLVSFENKGNGLQIFESSFSSSKNRHSKVCNPLPLFSKETIKVSRIAMTLIFLQ